MNEAYRRLRSRLPERRASAACVFNANPRAVRAWLDALPTANVAAAATRMRVDLGDFNRQRVDGLQRLETLELLRPALFSLAAALDKQILGASFPLPPQKEELGSLALELQGEFACGYRSALAEITAPAGAIPLLRGKTVALAAARALYHGGEYLATAYRLYRTPPRGAWQALHDTYRFAAARRFDAREAPDALQSTTACARELYAQALLAALANPYRHTQREQGDVIALARTLAPYLRLRARGGGERDVAVHADADCGPGYTPEERDGAEHDVLTLNLDSVTGFIDSQLAATPPGVRTVAVRRRGGSALHVDTDLLHRVAAHWRAHGLRNHARLEGGYRLDTVLGLHELHYALAGDEDFESFMQRTHGEAISLGDDQRAASWRAAARNSGRSARLTARVLDQGLGGYRLVWERGAAVRARVADLVGLALPAREEDTPDWMVGVVRWLRVDDDGQVDAGIEVLARRALPAAVQPVDGEGVRIPVRGLMLAPLSTDTGVDYPALLVSTEIDRGVRELELSTLVGVQGMPLQTRRVRASGLRLRETTGIYHHFALAPPTDAAADASATAAALPAGA